MNRPRPACASCVCTSCTMVREANRILRDREPVVGAIVFNPDEHPRWFAALRSPVLTGVVTYKGVNVDEVIAAAQAVVEAHDNLRASDPAVRKIDLANAVESLREALPK